MITLYQNKQKIVFQKNKVANFYLCGPTVYDHVHIGNLRGSIIFSLLSQLLITNGYSVKYWQNVTDIDDKIIQKAKSQNQKENTVAQHYFVEYQKILNHLHLYLPTFIKVTDHIPKMINFIEQLVKQKSAYSQPSGVYFDTEKSKQYQTQTVLDGGDSGKLDYGRNVKPSGVYFDTEKSKQYQTQTPDNSSLINSSKPSWSDKKNPADFVLWKLKTEGQTWNSLWGKGRPGWHTECTVLIEHLFAGHLDVHGGGTDLCFPHHYNETAQFVALYPQKKLTQFWLQNGLIHFTENKISKSKTLLSSLFLAKNFLDHYGPNVLKLIFYLTPYNQDFNLTQTKIDYCVQLDKKINLVLKKVQLKLILAKNKTLTEFDDFNPQFWKQLSSFLKNNLNTPLAIDLIFDTVKKINSLIAKKEIVFATLLTKSLLKGLNLLGIDFVLPVVDLELKTEIIHWDSLIKAKKFILADKLRVKLQRKGILPPQ